MAKQPNESASPGKSIILKLSRDSLREVVAVVFFQLAASRLIEARRIWPCFHSKQPSPETISRASLIVTLLSLRPELNNRRREKTSERAGRREGEGTDGEQTRATEDNAADDEGYDEIARDLECQLVS